MELDAEQEELWNSYTEENREKSFWLFLNTFVEKWEKQVTMMMMMMMMMMIKTMMVIMIMMTKTMMVIRIMMVRKR